MPGDERPRPSHRRRDGGGVREAAKREGGSKNGRERRKERDGAARERPGP